MNWFTADRMKELQVITKKDVRRDLREIKKTIKRHAKYFPLDEYVSVGQHQREYATRNRWIPYLLERGFSITETESLNGYKEVRIYWK